MQDCRMVSSTFHEAIATFWCEICSEKFSALHYLNHHRQEKHLQQIHCQYWGVSFAQCRRFQLQKHEEECQKASYQPRGPMCRARQSRHRSPKHEVSREQNHDRPKDLSDKIKTTRKDPSTTTITTKTDRSSTRIIKTEYLTTFHYSTATTDRPTTTTTTNPKEVLLASTSTEQDDLPVSSELQIDLSGETFNTDLSIFNDDDTYSQPPNLFTQLETRQGTDSLDKINFSEIPDNYPPISSEPFLPLTVSLSYDQNLNLIVLTPGDTDNGPADGPIDHLPANGPTDYQPAYRPSIDQSDNRHTVYRPGKGH